MTIALSGLLILIGIAAVCRRSLSGGPLAPGPPAKGPQRLAPIVVACATLASACGGSNNTIGPSNQPEVGNNLIGPSNQPEIGNNPDNFQFQASNLSHTTQTLSYSWVNSGSVADINQSGAVASGDARLTLRDGSGTLMYEKNLNATGTFASSSGVAGTGRIEVTRRDGSGTLNFRVQKRS